MSAPDSPPPVPPLPPLPPVPDSLPPPRTLSPERALNQLFLTLFLRGRTARGLNKGGAPKSVGSKLGLMLFLYGMFGALAITMVGQRVLALAVFLHSMTFMFLGMFIAASAGDVLFNKEEGDILLHRPVTPKALLRAKVGVLIRVSLWLGAAFNLAGLLVGIGAPDGGWRFPIVHAVSASAEALFCAGFVVVVYQLCLRWFGRERLDSIITSAQVAIAVAGVLAGQLVSRLFMYFRGFKLGLDSWWVGLLPPAWFAGFDDALAGAGTPGSWLLAGIGLVATMLVVWLAFTKLARDYQTGLQNLGEAPAPKSREGRRWISAAVNAPPLSWWLRDSVSRGAFVLSAAYLVRDRSVKLRVYPAIAQIFVMPVIILLPGGHSEGIAGFQLAFAGVYLGLVPLLVIDLLRYSDHWQAADVYRMAPVPGPAALCHGTRWAVLFFIALPLAVLGVGLIACLSRDFSRLAMLIPGLLILPLYALIPCRGGRAVPFSIPVDDSKSLGRGLGIMVAMMGSLLLAGIAAWAANGGWLWWMVSVEAALVLVAYLILRVSIDRARWPSLD